MSNKNDLIPAVSIEKKIMLLRGQKVMLASDLAAMYGVTTFNLNKAVNATLTASRMTSCFNLHGKRLQT